VKLFLKNFRSHKKFELELGRITAIIGPNGCGKTNILEAISFISAARSFRVDDKRSLIRLGADFCQIKLDQSEVIISHLPRLTATFKIKGVKKRIYDFVGRLPSVVFNPESLEIITDGPAARRRFLDSLLSQTNHHYLKALIDYRQVLLRRNRLLSLVADGEAREDELVFWDERLALPADLILAERKKLVKNLQTNLPGFYSRFASKNHQLNIAYKTHVEGEMLTKLRQKRQIEVAARTTIYGPHRDDLVFTLDNQEADKYASRGEIRSIVLALKLSELKFIEETLKVMPLLLLDDVYSELDRYHREQLFGLIKEYQTVITTTDIDHLSSEMREKAEVVEL
jgi:DNA replication and repair protein RecF